MMAGYSGTPLPKKLGIKEQFRVAFVDMPASVKSELRDALTSCKVSTRGPLDYVHLFVTSQTDLEKAFVRFRPLLAPAGMIWVSWPKKTSGVSTDVTENDVRRIGLVVGLVDVKVCAINEVWSGLKFVIRVKDR
jgi:hypothetical protein